MEWTKGQRVALHGGAAGTVEHTWQAQDGKDGERTVTYVEVRHDDGGVVLPHRAEVLLNLQMTEPAPELEAPVSLLDGEGFLRTVRELAEFARAQESRAAHPTNWSATRERDWKTARTLLEVCGLVTDEHCR
jgi:hypothetical protein